MAMKTHPLHNVDQNNQPILIDAQKVIAKRNPQYKVTYQILDNLQGNILKDHGRDYALHFFLRGFPKSDRTQSEKTKRSIQKLAKATYPLKNQFFPKHQEFHYVVSAIEHYILSRLSDKNETKYGKTYCVNIVFSRKGYDALGYSPPNESSFAGSLKAAPARFERDFREHIHEPIPMNHWEAQYDNLDAMILVAHQDKEMLVDGNNEQQIADKTLRELIEAFKDYVVAVEFGHVMYNDPKKTQIV